MEFIGFVIAIAVSYQALKGYKLANERTLLYLHLSFLLLGAGLAIDGLANLIVLLVRFHRAFLFLSSLGYTINFIAQVVAYGLLVFAYIQQTRTSVSQVAMAAAMPALLFEHNPVTELILLFLLVYIATQTGINYSVNKTASASFVFGAFVSLAIAHLFFLFFTFSAPVFFALAQIAQLFGFLLLLAMLLRVNHPS